MFGNTKKIWFFLLFIIINIRLILSEIDYAKNWTLGYPPFNVSAGRGHMALGYDSTNNSIVLVAGWPLSGYNFVKSYNIDDNKFIKHDSTYNLVYVYFVGQSYTQIGDILYFTNNPKDRIESITMDTKQFTSLNDLPYSTPESNACLCNFNDNYLILNGGYYYGSLLKNVAIYSISEDKWLDNVPYLENARKWHSCIVYNDYIYAFGGNLDGTIEKLYIGNDTINNLNDSHWELINDTLSSHGEEGRAVIYENKILIFHGEEYIDIFDPITDKIISTVSPLAYRAVAAGVITVKQKIYFFGGWNSGTSTYADKWQFVDYSTTKNCDCNGGMVSLAVEYYGDCESAEITAYYNAKKNVDKRLNCTPSIFEYGDLIRCIAAPNYQTFGKNTHFGINCVNDGRKRRKRRKRRRSSSSSEKRGKNKLNLGDCTAKFDTSCNKNIIGRKSKWCKDLIAVSYISGDGAICDSTVSIDYDDNKAIIIDEKDDNNNNNKHNSSLAINCYFYNIVLIIYYVFFV